MDPQLEKYFRISPYGYTANNPIRFIDPDGTSITDYEVDPERGLIIRVSSVDNNPDRLFGTNLMTGDREMLIVNDKNILSSLEHKQEENIEDPLFGGSHKRVTSTDPETGERVTRVVYQMAKGRAALTNSAEEALNVFDFASRTSNVEWGITGSVSGKWAVGTLNRSAQAPSFSSLGDDFIGGNIQFRAHSHSGADPYVDFLPSGPDRRNADKIRELNPKANIFLYRPQYPNLEERWIHIR